MKLENRIVHHDSFRQHFYEMILDEVVKNCKRAVALQCMPTGILERIVIQLKQVESDDFHLAVWDLGKCHPSFFHSHTSG